MRNKIEEETYEAAFRRFGEPHQLLLCFEEMAELTKAISKAIRYTREGHKTAITEELADVYIMLEQVKMIFNIEDDDVEMWKLDKIVRLRRTVGILPKEEKLGGE